MSTQRLNAFLIEEYSQEGKEEVQRNFHPAGKVVFHKTGGGLTLHIPPGMSLSGQVVCYPPKEKASQSE
jgi:hypothetical protein